MNNVKLDVIDPITVYDTRENTFETPTTVTHAVCLVSGGMDSATCLYHAVKLYGAENVLALSAYYGQRSNCELEFAEASCKKLGVTRIEMNLSEVLGFNKSYSSYIQGSDRDIEDGSYADIIKAKVEKGEAPICDEYIPNRNSLLLNVACAIGLQYFGNKKFTIIQGIHSDDALHTEGSNLAAYPDCTLEFANAENRALQFATAGLCYIYTPLVAKTKTQVVEFGVDNGMTKEDFEATWSCYKGRREEYNGKPCGTCPTDRDRIRALIQGISYTREDVLKNYAISEEECDKLYGDLLA